MVFLLAKNVPNHSLEIIPSRVKNLDELLKKLSKVVKISEHDIKNFKKQIKYKGRFESIPIRNKLSEEEVALFAVNRYKYPEVEIGANLSRNYTMGEEFSHVLGYIGPISETDLNNIEISKYRGVHFIGKSGLEKSYEEILLGKGRI